MQRVTDACATGDAGSGLETLTRIRLLAIRRDVRVVACVDIDEEVGPQRAPAPEERGSGGDCGQAGEALQHGDPSSYFLCFFLTHLPFFSFLPFLQCFAVGAGVGVGEVVAGAMTVKARAAGVGSTLSAKSVARTSNVWAPAPRPETACGEVHGANAAPSMRHSNVTGETGGPSLAVKPKLAEVSVVLAGGPEVMLVSGGDPRGGPNSPESNVVAPVKRW